MCLRLGTLQRWILASLMVFVDFIDCVASVATLGCLVEDLLTLKFSLGISNSSIDMESLLDVLLLRVVKDIAYLVEVIYQPKPIRVLRVT